MSDVREITQAWKAANAFLREKDEALRQLDALRKRNEKLERVVELARKTWHEVDVFMGGGGEAWRDLGSTLSDLDREDV